MTRVMSLGQLAASVAHEINQPLTSIVANAAAALRALAGANPRLDMVRESLADIVSDGRRAGQLIRRIWQLTTKNGPPKARLDMNDVIDGVVPLVRLEVLKHHVSFDVALSPALPPILGDRVQLQQVIINLVMNGIEAMAMIDDRPRALSIRSHTQDGDWVLVAVEDAGVGLHFDDVERLFTAFVTTKPAGMGMGLSISRSIVEAHGGRLWGTSNPTHGATFKFALPVPR